MLVSDLRHFLDLPDDAPGPAVSMAERLSFLVRAATAGPTTVTWLSALPCTRRPGRRRCQGRMAVARSETEALIDWRCDTCGDEGVISGWEATRFDLRRRSPRSIGVLHQVATTDEVAACLRDLLLIDSETERLIFAAQADRSRGRVLLGGDDNDFEDLAGCVAAEANHESDRKRQRRLDEALAAIDETARRA